MHPRHWAVEFQEERGLHVGSGGIARAADKSRLAPSNVFGVLALCSPRPIYPYPQPPILESETASVTTP